MRIIILLITTALLSVISVSGQFVVKIDISKNDSEAEKIIADSFARNFEPLKDISFNNEGKFEIRVEVLKRPVDDDISDYFLSVISTATTFCAVEMDGNGRVVSATKCKELLTSNSYVGRENEIDGMIKEFVSTFNAFVIEPLREIAKDSN